MSKNDLVGSWWPLILCTYTIADRYDFMVAGARPLAHKKEMNNVWFQKISIPPPRRELEIPKGRGGSKTQEIPGGRGVV